MEKNRLDQKFDELIGGAREKITWMLQEIGNRQSARGLFISGRTQREFCEATTQTFKTTYLECQKYAFHLSSGFGDVDRLDEFAAKLIDVLMAIIFDGRSGLRLGLAPHPSLRNDLDKLRRGLTEDFRLGILDGVRPKKDTEVKVNVNQSNSPGANAQVGVGNNISQTVHFEAHQELINAVNQALESREFVRLSHEQKEEFRNTATIVTDEASKRQPDVGKLRYWGGRLIQFAEKILSDVIAAAIKAHLP